MSRVRILVGTRKGAFVLTADGTRRHWDVSGPHFGGWEIYHLKGSPADPNRLYASQSSSWFGQVIQRSSNGGKSWTQIAQVPGTVTSYSDVTVTKGKTYQYRVNAYNSAGTSPWSNVATVKTPHRAPGRTHSPYPEPDFPTRVHVRAAKHHHDHHAPRHADTSRPHDRPRNS